MDWIAGVIAVAALVLGVVLAIRGRTSSRRAREALARAERIAAEARDALRSSAAALRDSDAARRQTDITLKDSALAVRDSSAALADSTVALTESAAALADSAAALADSTTALEDSTLALRERGEPTEAPQRQKSPWKLLTHGKRFSFRNVSDDVLSAVALEQTNGNDLTPLQEMPVREVAPGEEIAFTVTWTYSSPPTAQVTITWHVGGGPVREYRTTLA